jgi:hypothetical protein
VNPFTKYLSQWSGDGRFDDFIGHWDRLERLVIGVYRGKIDPSAAGPEYEDVWPWLRAHYPEWEATLAPHWRQTRAAGEPIRLDPFRLMLAIPSPKDITGDWRAMQHLPAAREAINRYLAVQGDQSARPG